MSENGSAASELDSAAASADASRWGEGSLFDLARRSVDFQRDPIRFFARIRDHYGATALFARPNRGWSRLSPLVVTSDPQLLRRILTDPSYRNSALALSGPRGSSHRRIRHSLFRMHGEEHRRHRGLIAPTLQKKAVLGYCDAMGRVVEAVSESWQPGQQRELVDDMKELALHLAGTSLFGIDDLRESARIGHMIEDWWGDNFKVMPRVFGWDLPGTAYRRMLGKADVLDAELRAMIARKRAAAADEEGEGGDLLTRLIRARDERGGLSEDELIGQTNVMFLAAHETTAYALVWTLFLLAQHPEAAERVCAELASELRGAAPRAEQLDALPALSRAIDESLRILPIVPFGARIAAEPVEIGGRPLPRKSRVLMPFHLLHHDARYFSAPRRFDPDRWIDFEPEPYTYLPFSAGLHMCVGVSFAKLSMQVALAILLQRFRYALPEGLRIDRRVTVTMSPREGIPVELRAADAGWKRARVEGSVRDLVDLD